MKLSIAVGRIAVPIKTYEGEGVARFTLVSEKNDHYLIETGPDSFQAVQQAGITGAPVLVAGEDFSFYLSRCHGHHSGLRASLVLPLSELSLEHLNRMHSQLIKLLPIHSAVD